MAGLVLEAEPRGLEQRQPHHLFNPERRLLVRLAIQTFGLGVRQLTVAKLDAEDRCHYHQLRHEPLRRSQHAAGQLAGIVDDDCREIDRQIKTFCVTVTHQMALHLIRHFAQHRIPHGILSVGELSRPPGRIARNMGVNATEVVQTRGAKAVERTARSFWKRVPRFDVRRQIICCQERVGTRQILLHPLGTFRIVL
jgi:hypothetical protein